MNKICESLRIIISGLAENYHISSSLATETSLPPCLKRQGPRTVDGLYGGWYKSLDFKEWYNTGHGLLEHFLTSCAADSIHANFGKYKSHILVLVDFFFIALFLFLKFLSKS